MAELIAALDVPTAGEAMNLVGQLQDVVSWYKVGLELFLESGPDMVRQLKAQGLKVFLDLKIYDIPRTAAAAARACAAMGADMLTAHCQGGERMCEAMADALDSGSGQRPILAGVTALTSFGPGEMPGIGEAPEVFGRELAKMAVQWGLRCVVCSPWEVGAIKALGLMTVCPGIRPAGADNADQRRVSTPAQASANGADFLVVGRPITQARSPREAARQILAQMDSCKIC